MTSRPDLTVNAVRELMQLEEHKPSGKLRISPSSKKLFGECTLRWWYVKVQKVKDAGSEASRFGNRTHKLLEAYHAGTWWEPSDRDMLPEELCLSRVLPAIPSPSLWMPEVKVTGMCGALPYVGYIDVFGRPDKGLFMGDLKTSGDIFKYLPGPGGNPLEWDPQMLFYLKAGVDKFPTYHRVGTRPETVRAEHYQSQRPDRGWAHRHVVKDVPFTNIETNWANFEVVSDQMAKASQVTDPMELPFNTDACFSYGKPCPAAAMCPRNPANVGGVPTLANPFAGTSTTTNPKGSDMRPATPENQITPPDAAPQAVQTESIMIEFIEWLHAQIRENGQVPIQEAKAQRKALGVVVESGPAFLEELARSGIGPNLGTADSKWRDAQGNKSSAFVYRNDLDVPVSTDPEPAPDPGNNPAPEPEPEPAPDTDNTPDPGGVPPWAKAINSLKRADMIKVVRALQADVAAEGAITEPKVRQRVMENSQITRVRSSMIDTILNIMAESGMGERRAGALVPVGGMVDTPTPAAKPATSTAAKPDPSDTAESKPAAAMNEPTILVISGVVSGEVGMEMMSFDDLVRPFIDQVEAEGGKVNKVFEKPLPSYLVEEYTMGPKRVHAAFKVALMSGRLKLPRMLHAYVGHPMFNLVMPDIKNFYRGGIIVNAGGR